MTKLLSAVLSDEQGQGLAEYGMILGLVAVVCYTAVKNLGSNVNTVLSNVGGDI